MGHPTFLIIGAQKSGTTSLHAYLRQHPRVSLAERKELHYFDRERDYPDHDWYRAQFTPTDNTPQSGEATPIYCFWQGAIERIHQFNPAMKLVLILRNPIDRAISQYWMEFNRGDEFLPITDAFRFEEQRLKWGCSFHERHHTYLARGHYARQIDNILTYFPREQLLILRLEDVVANAQPHLKRLSQFLGVDYRADIEFPALFAGKKDETPFHLREWLYAVFQPLNADLTHRYGIPTADWLP